MPIIPIILAGGIGSRLWPLSKPEKPKQFLQLAGDKTLFQQAILRAYEVSQKKPLILCNHRHIEHIESQLEILDLVNAGIDADLLTEPCGRNTAPAIALAAFELAAQGADPIMLILPADHQIKDKAALVKSVEKARLLAAKGHLVALGIDPVSPNPHFGYIKRGQSQPHAATSADCSPSNGLNVSKISQFVEKPNVKLAKTYLEAGDYYWNSGIYLIKASRYLAELKQNRPIIYQCCQQAHTQAIRKRGKVQILDSLFEKCPSESMDYAVMEHCEDAFVVELDAGWKDFGVE